MKILSLAVICCTLLVAGCGNTPVPAGTPALTKTVSVAQGVYDAEGLYIAARYAMTAYEKGSFGKPAATTVAAMQKADDVAYKLLVPLRADAQANKPIAQTSLDALTAAILQFQSINTAAGVK